MTNKYFTINISPLFKLIGMFILLCGFFAISESFNSSYSETIKPVVNALEWLEKMLIGASVICLISANLLKRIRFNLAGRLS